MEQLEKIERNRKLPLRPQEVESMCSNCYIYSDHITCVGVPNHFEILNKYVSLCVKIESGSAMPGWSLMLYFIVGLSRVNVE